MSQPAPQARWRCEHEALIACPGCELALCQPCFEAHLHLKPNAAGFTCASVLAREQEGT
jgi:hypothetical protein